MALYTGINAIQKVKGVSSNILIHVPFYSDYIGEIRYSESQGGYPKYQYLLDFLNVDNKCGIDNYNEDTEENYNHFHQQYKSIIEERERIIQDIDKYDLLNQFKYRELIFVKREYDLANYLGANLNSNEFYFRKIVHSEVLIPLLESAKEAVGIDFSHPINEIKKILNEYDFEVHVS